MAKIRLPNNWDPRAYQRPLWDYLEAGGRHAVAVWHRRSGKDDVALHRTCIAAHERVGNYWHMLPEYSHARKAIWDAINPNSGLRRVDEAFPLAIRRSTNNQEMKIELKSGSIWQLVGSDNFNALIGSPPIGIVYSEWAVANPKSHGYLRPILAENNGWSLFIYTSRGYNHGFTTYEAARKDHKSFAQRLTVDDTSVFNRETLESELISLSMALMMATRFIVRSSFATSPHQTSARFSGAMWSRLSCPAGSLMMSNTILTARL